jgi:hypothetical protein
MVENNDVPFADLSAIAEVSKMQENNGEKKNNHPELKVVYDPSEPTGVRSEPQSSAPKKRSKSKAKAAPKKEKDGKTQMSVFIYDSHLEIIQSYAEEHDVSVGAGLRYFLKLGIQQAKDKG